MHNHLPDFHNNSLIDIPIENVSGVKQDDQLLQKLINETKINDTDVTEEIRKAYIVILNSIAFINQLAETKYESIFIKEINPDRFKIFTYEDSGEIKYLLGYDIDLDKYLPIQNAKGGKYYWKYAKYKVKYFNALQKK